MFAPFRKLLHYALTNHGLVGGDIVNFGIYKLFHLILVVYSPNVYLQSQLVSLGNPIPILLDVSPRVIEPRSSYFLKLCRRNPATLYS